MNSRILLIALTLVAVVQISRAASLPNIVFILADDYGWANVGYHREVPTPEVQTPNIDELVKNGVELDRHYVFMYCSPTRSAIQSGRNPIHVNVLNLEPTYYNPANNISGYSAIPRNMTGIATKLKSAGYDTHMAGKWDAGMATPDHSPQGRGYDTSLHYWHHANDYWTFRTGVCLGHPIVDFWNTDHPAKNATNPPTCSQADQKGCSYEDGVFENHVLKVINDHDTTHPLFLFWAPHNVHAPLEVPQAYLNKFDFIDDLPRRHYHAMVNYMDTAIGNAIDALKKKGMFENTLIVFSSDNGGPIYSNGTAGANNYPLRGGKMTNWEGGVRVNAFVSGGFVPEKVRGTKQEGYITGWDWYATFCAIAGVDPTDHRAALAGLPPIDSINVWPLVSGQTDVSPRTEVPLGAADGLKTVVTGLIQGDYKLLLGPIPQASWTGPQYPNITTNWNPEDVIDYCGLKGCLFNIKEDPTEHEDLVDKNPEIADKLRQRIVEITKTLFDPDRGDVDPAACATAVNKYGDYWGPWLE